MADNDVNYYLGLPYTVQVRRDQDDEFAGWIAEVLELPGCMTQADNNEELGGMILDAMRAWIETALEDGIAIPEPRALDDYSGKFVVRVPKSLHRDLVVEAEQEGVSLNQWINVLLAKSLYAREMQNEQEKPYETNILNSVPKSPSLETALFGRAVTTIDSSITESEEFANFHRKNKIDGAQISSIYLLEMQRRILGDE